jgi:phosphoglycolate phosphatase-like HAD superfamily hydrolase
VTCDDIAVERCIESYRRVYYPLVSERSPLFPDSAMVVEELALRGIPLGIVSGKNLVGIRRVLEPSGLLIHFNAIVGSDHGCPSKPAPDAALAAAEILGVAAASVVVVGDSLLDVEMGIAAGMATVGVATGTADRDTLASRATVSIDSLKELLPLLRRD